jgi:hypothetical protein
MGFGGSFLDRVQARSTPCENRVVVALTLLEFLGWAGALLLAMALAALVFWLFEDGFYRNEDR